MQQEVTVDATTMAQGLKDAGSIAIYGIHFDTAKSDLKPDSKPALGEIAKLLKTNAALKLFIVGHTDLVGDAAINLKLSQERAQTVLNAVNRQIWHRWFTVDRLRKRRLCAGGVQQDRRGTGQNPARGIGRSGNQIIDRPHPKLSNIPGSQAKTRG